jgi:hypothetical protein
MLAMWPGYNPQNQLLTNECRGTKCANWGTGISAHFVNCEFLSILTEQPIAIPVGCIHNYAKGRSVFISDHCTEGCHVCVDDASSQMCAAPPKHGHDHLAAASLPAPLWHVLVLIHRDRILDGLPGSLSSQDVIHRHVLVLVFLVILEEAADFLQPASPQATISTVRLALTDTHTHTHMCA